MKAARIIVCLLLLILPVVLYLYLDPAVRLSKWNLATGITGSVFFLDLPIAVCLCHWFRPEWFRLKKSGWYSPYPWLLLGLVTWGYVAGLMYLSIRFDRGPENGFAIACAYLFGWAYIWFTMIPIGTVYLLIRLVMELVNWLKKRMAKP